MSKPRTDGSRLFQRLGLAPADYLQFAQVRSELRLGEEHRRVARPDRIADPAVRAAFLRAQLLATLPR